MDGRREKLKGQPVLTIQAEIFTSTWKLTFEVPTYPDRSRQLLSIMSFDRQNINL